MPSSDLNVEVVREALAASDEFNGEESWEHYVTIRDAARGWLRIQEAEPITICTVHLSALFDDVPASEVGTCPLADWIKNGTGWCAPCSLVERRLI